MVRLATIGTNFITEYLLEASQHCTGSVSYTHLAAQLAQPRSFLLRADIFIHPADLRGWDIQLIAIPVFDFHIFRAGPGHFHGFQAVIPPFAMHFMHHEIAGAQIGQQGGRCLLYTSRCV